MVGVVILTVLILVLLSSIVLEQDLLGDWVIVQSWGGKYNARGGKKNRMVNNYAEGLIQLQKIIKLRLHHGYRQIE